MKNKPTGIIDKLKSTAKAHKYWSFAIVIIVIAAAYGIYRSSSTANAETQYAIARARIGKITQTITGTGQISAANQLDMTSQVSGTIQSIAVKVGQSVRAGQLLATIDSSDAANSLESARIAYQKLVKPPTSTELSNAQDNLTKAYSDGFNTVASTFLNLPDIMTGMKDMLYGQDSFLSDQRSSYLISSARGYRNTAGQNYDLALKEYDNVLAEYRNLTRTSATSSIERLIDDTYDMARDVAATMQDTQNAITYIVKTQPDYQPSLATTAVADVNAWSNTINNAVSSLLSAKNSITSNQNSLNDLVAGADELDIRSQQLSLRQQEKNYQDYFIRAPFDGIVGRIPVNVYEKAGSGTAIATIIGNQKIATISLNEIDAAKVKAGQPVSIIFDAIDDLTATGTVSEVDLVGAVSQGVVAYGVKIAIGTMDTRILPGMSVNVTITTREDSGVLVVPSSAIKTQGKRNYVQVIDNPPLTSSRMATSSAAASPRLPSGSGNGNTMFAASFGGNASQIVAASTSIVPREVTVTIGNADDTNTEIASGLSGGEWVITKTTTSGGTTQTTSAPSILQSVGGNRTGNNTFRAISR